MALQGRKALPPSGDPDITDAFSRNWRRWLKGLQRAGVIGKMRRRFHKKARRAAREATVKDYLMELQKKRKLKD